jgi:CheY-like chemotaxis protein
MTTELSPVLYAEDEESDAFLFQRAFQKVNVSHPLVVVKDGQEAVNYLSARKHHSDRHDHPVPALIILDLKMPRMTGFDVLGWISGRPELKEIPVIVLSSSSAEADIRKAREMGARDYLVKPHHLAEYMTIVQALHARWLHPAAGLTR